MPCAPRALENTHATVTSDAENTIGRMHMPHDTCVTMASTRQLGERASRRVAGPASPPVSRSKFDRRSSRTQPPRHAPAPTSKVRNLRCNLSEYVQVYRNRTWDDGTGLECGEWSLDRESVLTLHSVSEPSIRDVAIGGVGTGESVLTQCQSILSTEMLPLEHGRLPAHSGPNRTKRDNSHSYYFNYGNPPDGRAPRSQVVPGYE